MDELGSDIKARRRALELNQRTLAELSGTSEGFIRDLEHRKASIRLDKAMAVLTKLGVDPLAVARSR